MSTTILASLTESQIDAIIRHFGTLVAAISSLATTAGVAVLIWRQSKNKKDLVARIDANTEISTTAFDTANGHNSKIVELSQQVASAVEEIKGAKSDKLDPEEK
ncbi:hypothetical protein [Luteolibacter soli]|uniref:Uncharacterized protein n=1 Tax=Luteolibacter soli TaxID=3135280 RepID=A0ABU9AYF1_9BACT